MTKGCSRWILSPSNKNTFRQLQIISNKSVRGYRIGIHVRTVSRRWKAFYLNNRKAAERNVSLKYFTSNRSPLKGTL